MISRRAGEALAGLGYLVVLAALVALSLAVYNKDFSHEVSVNLLTDDVGSSLQKGSDVKVRGVLVGQVKKLSTDGTGAKLELQIDPAKAKLIPADVTAQLLPKTLFGERYVSLIIPANASTKTLHSGDVINQDTSPKAVEIQQVFGHLLPVLQAIQPEKLASFLGELAQGLDNHGAALGTTLTTLNTYLTKLGPTVPGLTADLSKLASVADTYTDAVPDLVNALDSLTTTSETISAERQQLSDLFGTVTSAAGDVDGFVQSNSDQIIGLSADSLPTLQTFAHYSTEFPCVTKALVNFIPTANKALGSGTSQPGLHVVLNVVPSLGKYVAGKDSTKFTDSSGPRCPYVPGAGLNNTALGSTTPASTHTATSSFLGMTAAQTAGLGTANSPQENQLISELVAPTMGISPEAFPSWNSLLLGPTLRSTVVTLK